MIALIAMAAYSASSSPSLPDAAAARIAALESATQKGTVAIGAVEKRVAAVESANSALGSKVAAAAQSAEQASAAAKALSAAAPAADGSAPAPAPAPDLAPLVARIDQLEAALAAEKAAPKAETRVAPEAPTATIGGPSAVAIVTEAVRDKLTTGAPFAGELAALQSLGVDAGLLAPLKPVVDGSPTAHALATAFAQVAPDVLAAAIPKGEGSIADRFIAHMRGLVIVHDLHEKPGDTPNALVSQVEALTRRGDLKGAMAAFAKLPEPARKAASTWAAQAEQALAASEALQAIQDDAIGRLSAGGKS